MAVKHLIFDFDGVIADTADTLYALCQAADPDMTVDDFMAHHDGNVYETPRIRFTEASRQQFGAEYANRLSPSHVAAAIAPLKRLAAHYQLFIVSSSEEGAINAVLTTAGIDTLFAAVYGYQTHTSKVKKFEMIRDRFDVTLSEAIFVTDTLGDVKEGNAVGLTVIAETFGFHPRERLVLGQPYAIVDSWSDIESTIKKLS